jgi:hypothetical protein
MVCLSRSLILVDLCDRHIASELVAGFILIALDQCNLAQLVSEAHGARCLPLRTRATCSSPLVLATAACGGGDAFTFFTLYSCPGSL